MNAMVETVNGSVTINLTDSQVEWCREHAQKTKEHHDNTGTGVYSHNRLFGAIVGARCEVAAEVYLTRIYQSMETNYRGDIENPDIELKEKPIEVKGLRGEDWDELKRMVPPKQLEKYVSKGSILLWLTTEPQNKVIIRGWNFAADVASKGEEVKTICDNVWLKDDEDMRSLDTLAAALRGDWQ